MQYLICISKASIKETKKERSCALYRNIKMGTSKFFGDKWSEKELKRGTPWYPKFTGLACSCEQTTNWL